MIEIRHITHAITLARHRNFARAADALGISQPALTRSIQVLEDNLGVKLFDRHPRDVVPTAFGQLFIERGESILKANSNLQREIDLMRGMEIGELVIGAGPYATRMLLGPVVARFSKHFPNVKINVIVEGWPNLSSQVRNGEIDLFVGDTIELENDDDLTFNRLSRYPGVFFCRKDHPILANPQTTLADMLSYPLALPAVLTSRLHALFDNDETNERPSDTELTNVHRITCNNIYLLKTAVENSDAYGVAAPIMIEQELENGRLAIIPYNKKALFAIYGVAYPNGLSLSPAASAFIELLKEYDQELVLRSEALMAHHG